MKQRLVFFGLLTLSLCLGACARHTEPKYHIGVSQCNDDLWRRKMNQELQYEQILHPEVSLSFRQAEANSALQCQQIDSFIAEGVDLLIVCPNEADEVEPAVQRAFQSGIPVVMSDRNISTEDYTAFVGGDNKQVGHILAQHLHKLSAQMSKPLRVIEIIGLPGSTPARLRHQSLQEVLRTDPSVQLVAIGCGNWFEKPAERAVDSLLRIYPDVDVIVAQNDVMARGSARACRRLNRDIIIVGVDGITGPGGGIEAVREGLVSALATYPSRGDIVLRRALQILRGEAFPRNTIIRSVMVGPDEADPMALLAEERETEVVAIAALQDNVYALMHQYNMQRVMIVLLLLLIVLLTGVFVGVGLFLRYRHRVRLERQEKEAQLHRQQEMLSMLSEQLEQSHRQVSSADDADKEFVSRLTREIELHMGEPELAVESLATSLGMSRSVLFRRVKNIFGVSPVDLIRKLRLERAHGLLKNKSLNIQQIAYEVGFSSPGYFAKCYKEKYGVSPGDEKNRS